MGHERVADGIHRPHDALPGVVGVHGLLVVQFVDLIEFFLLEVAGRGILYQPAGVLKLAELLAGDGVVGLVELVEHLDEVRAGFDDSGMRRQLKRRFRLLASNVAEPPDSRGVLAVAQGGGQLARGTFAHPVDEKIGLGIEKQ